MKHSHAHKLTHMLTHTHLGSLLFLLYAHLTNLTDEFFSNDWLSHGAEFRVGRQVQTTTERSTTGAGELLGHGSGRWRSAIDVPPLAPICGNTYHRAITKTFNRQLTKDDLFWNPASVYTSNLTKPTLAVLAKTIHRRQQHAKPLRKC